MLRDPEFPIAGFILCVCLIDQLAGFRYNKECVGDRFRKFAEEYLVPLDNRYDPSHLYNDLRCKLIHEYSIGGNYALTNCGQEHHLKVVDGRVWLGIIPFVDHLENILTRYIDELHNDKKIQDNAIAWYGERKIIGMLHKN
mgnify:CR=1 FL=1